MHIRSYILFCFGILFFFLAIQPVKAQLGYELDIKKPEPYENRELRAEKTGTKKFTKSRHFFQNTYTHYNYFFNANNRLNEVIDRAKESFKDNYAVLLPFYNYSLETTAQDKTELDSIIYKSKTGIVMHDLRNDWIDDLYLIWGAAYYLQKKFDSAHQMFQFINYAFADKEKDGYYRYIGSHMDGNTAVSIATKEDDGLVKRMISDPPSRNTAFIWQIRTLIEANAMTEAGSLIATLKKDPAFPERLNTSLNEVQAYWFYKQDMWDSASVHLILALDNATTKQERARWEYLIAQLSEKAKKAEIANEYYLKAISHTVDPIMDIYARLDLIRLNKEGGDQYIEKNIADLLKMANRERYADYRDLIYFMAAQIEMERNNSLAAQKYLLEGAKYANNNPASRNQSFLQLADLYFTQKNYTAAASFYDSIQAANLQPSDADRVVRRRASLLNVVTNIYKINRQDSLQRVAVMPEEERTDYLKKLVRRLRREQGLKEEPTLSTGVALNASTPDAFETNTKGEWYFYNSTLKKQGAAIFKQVWGNRPNVDNWRRASDAASQLLANAPNNTRGVDVTAAAAAPNSEITLEGLSANLPLTPDQLKVSNEVVRTSMLQLGKAYLNDLEDYSSAIETYEAFRRRFPDYFGMSEVLFNLSYSYAKTGDLTKAGEMKNLLVKNYPTSRQASIVTTGADPVSTKPTAAVTKVYESIYDQFIEGHFEEAIANKRRADSIYKTNYWSPQLLYIEAVYHIKQREDTVATALLDRLIRQNPNSPLSNKAINLMQVLHRRTEIEQELRNLNIERPTEDTIYIAPIVKTPTAIKRDTTTIKTNEITVTAPGPKPRTDTLTIKPIAPTVTSSFVYDATVPQYVVVVLNKVDNVFGNEAKNAFNRYNKERYYNLPLNSELVPLDADNRLLLIGNFTNVLQATEYLQKTMQLAPREIVPWLKADKYSFTLISAANLNVLKNNPDLAKYRRFLEQSSGLKF